MHKIHYLWHKQPSTRLQGGVPKPRPTVYNAVALEVMTMIAPQSARSLLRQHCAPDLFSRLREGAVVPKTHLHLIRHAQTETNLGKIITGSRDVDLSEEGRLQASKLGLKLDTYYDIAFHSSLKRSEETLQIALGRGKTHLGRHPIRDDRLNEKSLGVLEGQVSRYIPEYANGDLDYAPSGGESYRDVAIRVLDFLSMLASLIEKPNTKVLICSHVGVMRILVGIIGDYSEPSDVLKLWFPNANLVSLEWDQLRIPKFLEKTN